MYFYVNTQRNRKYKSEGLKEKGEELCKNPGLERSAGANWTSFFNPSVFSLLLDFLLFCDFFLLFWVFVIFIHYFVVVILKLEGFLWPPSSHPSWTLYLAGHLYPEEQIERHLSGSSSFSLPVSSGMVFSGITWIWTPVHRATFLASPRVALWSSLGML